MSVEATVEESGVVEEVKRVKDAVAAILWRRALETGDEKTTLFYASLSRLLRRLPVKPGPPDTVAATDGNAIYVGGLLQKLRTKYGGEWRRLLATIVVHEAIHILYAHPSRMSIARDPDLYNIVADLWVNEVIRRYLWRPPRGMVTLDSFPAVVAKRNPSLAGKAREVAEAARAALDRGISVDQLYSILEPHAEMAKLVRGAFTGGDLGLGRRRGARVPGAERSGHRVGSCRGAGRGERREGGAEGEGGEGLDFGSEAAREGERLLGELRRAAEAARRALQAIKEAEGMLKALRSAAGGYTPPGVGSGAVGNVFEAEREAVKRISLMFWEAFLAEVGEEPGEPRYTFSEFDEDVYWLPAREEPPRRRAVLMVDTSGSIPWRVAAVFAALVRKALEHYNDLEYRLVAFADDALADTVLTGESLPERLTLPKGMGTWWGPRVARVVREELERGTRLIQVLSDFEISVEKEALDAIEEFRGAGGRVSCYSVSGRFLDFCDTRVRIPL